MAQAKGRHRASDAVPATTQNPQPGWHFVVPIVAPPADVEAVAERLLRHFGRRSAVTAGLLGATWSGLVFVATRALGGAS